MTAAQHDPFEGLIDALADLVRRHRNLTVRLSRESGLPAAQVAVLAAISRLGESRIADLAEDLLVDPSVVSRHVSPLEHSGSVERRQDPADARAALVRLTPQGEEALAQVRGLRRRHLEAALAEWSEADVAELTEVLGTVARFLDATHEVVR
ncbi:MarR family winged helix-turn-helix transcriptional regulator [Georgenia sp. H159]|uniref:MarR family winged helix-turn-helix transcriptional regulator n=1 Tax=Georgenia sp. H159 TaxID=3076115 RepID=UPI002D788406|nr:MarR family winged helix-turn-helix transcriptional regulator [Georgenia sp. H159]